MSRSQIRADLRSFCIRICQKNSRYCLGASDATIFSKRGSPRDQLATSVKRARVNLDLMMRPLLLVQIAVGVSLSSLHGQSASPTGSVARPEAIYTPMPVYRPEWAKQGLTGKGVVLVTIDKETGGVTGARMLESTGNQLLDGAALQAYSQWRFKPGTVTQLKMPIEFKRGPQRPTSAQRAPPPLLMYVLLILLGFAVAMLVARRRRA